MYRLAYGYPSGIQIEFVSPNLIHPESCWVIFPRLLSFFVSHPESEPTSMLSQPVTDEFLDLKRKSGDALADNVVAALIDAREIDNVDRGLVALVR